MDGKRTRGYACDLLWIIRVQFTDRVFRSSLARRRVYIVNTCYKKNHIP